MYQRTSNNYKNTENHYKIFFHKGNIWEKELGIHIKFPQMDIMVI